MGKKASAPASKKARSKLDLPSESDDDDENENEDLGLSDSDDEDLGLGEDGGAPEAALTENLPMKKRRAGAPVEASSPSAKKGKRAGVSAASAVAAGLGLDDSEDSDDHEAGDDDDGDDPPFDDDDNDNDPYGFGDGYDEHLLGDEEDRTRLAQMTEIDREEELAKRRERRDQLYFMNKTKLARKKDAEKREKRVTRRGGSTAKKTKDAQESALQRLERQRKKQTKSRRREDYDDDDMEDDDDDDDDDEESEEMDYADDGATFDVGGLERGGRSRRGMVMMQEPPEDLEPLDVEEDKAQEFLKGCVVTRPTLAKWLGEPFFENAVKGLFVRIKYPTPRGEKYLVATIERAVDLPTGEGNRKLPAIPELGKDFKVTHYIRCRRGDEGTEKAVTIDQISGDPPHTSEWVEYKNTAAKTGVALPSKSKAKKLIAQIENANNYRYTAEDVRAMVERKKAKRGGIAGGAFAIQKMRLTELRIEAEMQGDTQQLAEIDAKIASLKAQEVAKHEEMMQSRRRADLSMINSRNRNLNFADIVEEKGWGEKSLGGAIARAAQAALEDMSAEDMEGIMHGRHETTAANAMPDVDIFSRRNTAPKVLWNVKKESAGGASDAAAASAPTSGAANGSAAAAGAGGAPSAAAPAAREPELPPLPPAVANVASSWGRGLALGHVSHAVKVDLSRLPPSLRGTSNPSDPDDDQMNAGVPLGGFGSGYERVGKELAPGFLCTQPRRETISLSDYFRLHPGRRSS